MSSLLDLRKATAYLGRHDPSATPVVVVDSEGDEYETTDIRPVDGRLVITIAENTSQIVPRERVEREWTLEEITAPYDEAEHDPGDTLLGTVVQIQDEDGTLIPIGSVEYLNGQLWLCVPSILDLLEPEDVDAIYRKRGKTRVVPPEQDAHPEHHGEPTLWEASGIREDEPCV